MRCFDMSLPDCPEIWAFCKVFWSMHVERREKWVIQQAW